MSHKLRTVAGILSIFPIFAEAQEVRITPDMASKQIVLGNGKSVDIERIQDPDNHLTGDYTKTSRTCPPFCIHPMEAAPGVETVGELDVIKFIEDKVATGEGILLDARIPEWHAKGTIPGSINLPFSVLEESNPYRNEILKALGARETGSGWDFSNVKELMVYCNGPWGDQSPREIHHLREAGYPADKIKYYRGGMQVWLLLGLTVKAPQA